MVLVHPSETLVLFCLEAQPEHSFNGSVGQQPFQRRTGTSAVGDNCDYIVQVTTKEPTDGTSGRHYRRVGELERMQQNVKVKQKE